MLCYKDMTFCSFYDRCKEGKNCFRALTPKVISKSKEIHLPISQFVCAPKCFEMKVKK